mgnify:CR=1 FL=1
MVMEVRGVAHPRPDKRRASPADLSAAEIRGTQLAGRPLLNEHDHSARVGTVMASWEGRGGDLRMSAQIEDENVAQQVRSGKLRGLSLGTAMLMDDGGRVIFRGQEELSVCEEGKRQGCRIDHIDGKSVLQYHTASKKGARSRAIVPQSSCHTHATGLVP